MSSQYSVGEKKGIGCLKHVRAPLFVPNRRSVFSPDREVCACLCVSAGERVIQGENSNSLSLVQKDPSHMLESEDRTKYCR